MGGGSFTSQHQAPGFGGQVRATDLANRNPQQGVGLDSTLRPADSSIVPAAMWLFSQLGMGGGGPIRGAGFPSGAPTIVRDPALGGTGLPQDHVPGGGSRPENPPTTGGGGGGGGSPPSRPTPDPRGGPGGGGIGGGGRGRELMPQPGGGFGQAIAALGSPLGGQPRGPFGGPAQGSTPTSPGVVGGEHMIRSFQPNYINSPTTLGGPSGAPNNLAMLSALASALTRR